MPPIAKDRIERAARMYASNHDAGSALGIAPGSFSRLCRRYGIETPQARKRRQRSEWKQDYLSRHNRFTTPNGHDDSTELVEVKEQ